MIKEQLRYDISEHVPATALVGLVSAALVAAAAAPAVAIERKVEERERE